MKKVSAKKAWSVYRREGSLARAAPKLGVSPEWLSKTLRAAEHRLGGKRYTGGDDDVIRRYYTDTPPSEFSLLELTATLGRSSPEGVCRRAKQLGLTHKGRSPSATHRIKQATAANRRWYRIPRPRRGCGFASAGSADGRHD